MNPIINSWGPVVVIIIGYLLANHFQNKRLDDFKSDLYKYFDAKFETINIRLKHLEDDVADIKTRLRELEKVHNIIK